MCAILLLAHVKTLSFRKFPDMQLFLISTRGSEVAPNCETPELDNSQKLVQFQNLVTALLAVVWSLERFRNHLYGRPFLVRTDHRALLSALKSNRGNKTTFSRLARWVHWLLPFEFSLVHIPGKKWPGPIICLANPRVAPRPFPYSLTPLTQLFSVSHIPPSNTMRSPFELFSSWTRGSRLFDPPSDSTDDPVVDLTASSPEPTTTFAPVPPSAPLSPSLSLTSAASHFPSVSPPVPVLPVANPIRSPDPPTPASSLPVLTQATLNAIVAAVDAHHSRTPHTDSATNTESSLCVSEFSPDIIKVLTATDTELQALIQAVTSRSSTHRNALKEYWRSLLDDLCRHIVDGCLFLEEKIVIPLGLREAALTYLHAEHCGARGMKSKCDFLQSKARQCRKCSQIGKNLSFVQARADSAPRPPARAAFDARILDFWGLIGENPPPNVMSW